MLVVENGGYVAPESEPYIEPEPYITPETPIIRYITVDGIEYMLSGITNKQYITIQALKLTYDNFSESAKDIMPFDVYVYKMSNVKIIRSVFEPDITEPLIPFVPILDVLDIDTESPEFQLRLWWSDLQQKLKLTLDKFKWLTPVIAVSGIAITGLVGYQYSKSYVSEKGKVKARG